MFSKLKFSKFKINTTALGIVVLVLIFSALNLKPGPKPQITVTVPTDSPSMLTNTPAPDAQTQQLEVLRYYPPGSTPSIATTDLAVSFTFNRALTLQEMENMELRVNSLINPALVFDTNHKTVYIRPGEKWRNKVTYTITLSITDSLETFTHIITPNTKPPAHVIVYPDTHPITPSPAL